MERAKLQKTRGRRHLLAVSCCFPAVSGGLPAAGGPPLGGLCPGGPDGWQSGRPGCRLTGNYRRRQLCRAICCLLCSDYVNLRAGRGRMRSCRPAALSGSASSPGGRRADLWAYGEGQRKNGRPVAGEQYRLSLPILHHSHTPGGKRAALC